jgi:hypothetical protein
MMKRIAKLENWKLLAIVIFSSCVSGVLTIASSMPGTLFLPKFDQKLGPEQHFYKPNGCFWLTANKNVALTPVFADERR